MVLRFVCALVLLVTIVGPGRATVFAPMDDATLVASSDLVLTGTVTAVESREPTPHRLVTRTRVAVDRILKGAVDGLSVTVTTPGGHVGTTRAVVFGAPVFEVDEAVLLFLRRTPRGELQTTSLAMGVYRLATAADGTTLAVREEPFAETRALDEFAATAQALGDPGLRVGDDDTDVVPPPGGATFTFLGNPPARWVEPDQGLPVRYRVANADPSLGAAASNAVIDAALGAWTSVPTASIVLERGAPTSTAPSIAGGTCDGHSTIQFADPFGEIAPLDGCSGTLAVGGFCTGPGTTTVGQQAFERISEGDLTVADGLGRCLDRTGYAEIVTHEVGHTIGLGHSSENPNEPNPVLRDATMYFLAHLDGRGASLRADDVAGVSALYPDMVNPDDLDGDGVPNAVDACPTTPAATPVDTNGCGCGEAGHVACDDGLSCTTDFCDVTTGRCAAAPVDCTGGNPCVQGSCTEAAGCTTTTLTGDGAILCAYRRTVPPPACVVDRVPAVVRRRFRRAEHLAARALAQDRPALLAAAGRQLDRAVRVVERAESRRHRPLSAGCAATLTAIIGDARTRVSGSN